jgi:O-acetyl-ADP-ribose deacetylase (regulator of RNase III)
MIQEYEGSVFECKEKENVDCIVNTVNTKGFMGAGIALEFKLRYPDLYKVYKNKCKKNEIIVGRVDFYKGKDGYIINFPTKDDWKFPSKLEWIKLGLRDLKNKYKKYGIKSIAFPKLGAGKGGLIWADVDSLIRNELEDIEDLTIHICLDKREPKGVEGKMIKILKELDDKDLKEMSINSRARKKILESEIDRFYKLKSIRGVGNKTYEKLHKYCYQRAKEDLGHEDKQLKLYEFKDI